MISGGWTVVLWVAFAALALWVAWWVRREVRAARIAHRDKATRPQCLHLRRRVTHSDTDSVTWVCDVCGTEVTDPKETG